ncbi:MAG: selenocysteine-specific elongation factor [Solirubrobacteraceae bacterium]|jgi:selenocysteine-specific elongation factor|nr:selenocysteine-specific elongation factor [Solirubrobacteraceae bacterium]
MTAAPLTLGTAGHVDHGKTALIRALTGVDTDRLPAERERGISIELGYARLDLPSGRALSVVDVPGHERFVRTMVAGATGVDLFLMVVAADDGVMPQTLEHARVLAGLEVTRGVVAIAKSDAADPAPAARAAAELLPAAEVVATSARTGAGLDELRAALDRMVARLPGRADEDDRPQAARLHVDRAFTIRGAGTVVTGTLWSGSAGRGDAVELLPARRRARVRSVQVHGAAVERAAAGQRVALNLAGVALDEVDRGDVVVGAAAGLAPAWILDVALDLGDARHELAAGGRVQVHHGTRESPARVTPLGGPFHQLRLQRPLVAAAGDRLVVRRVAPPDTLGGGVVLDPSARRHGPSRDVLARLERLARGEAPEQPPAPPSAPAKRLESPPPLSAPARALAERLRAAGHQPPPAGALGADAEHLPALREAGAAVRVGRDLHYSPGPLAEVRGRVVALCERDGAVTIGALRDDLGTSRRFAQALLEHFDAERLTRREGDRHVLRRLDRKKHNL